MEQDDSEVGHPIANELHQFSSRQGGDSLYESLHDRKTATAEILPGLASKAKSRKSSQAKPRELEKHSSKNTDEYVLRSRNRENVVQRHNSGQTHQTLSGSSAPGRGATRSSRGRETSECLIDSPMCSSLSIQEGYGPRMNSIVASTRCNFEGHDENATDPSFTNFEHEAVANEEAAQKSRQLFDGLERAWCANKCAEIVGRAIVSCYHGDLDRTIIENLTLATALAQHYDLPDFAGRAQLWKAIILQKLGETAEMPHILGDILALIADYGNDSDCYQLMKFWPEYGVYVWQYMEENNGQRQLSTSTTFSDYDTAKFSCDQWCQAVKAHFESRFQRHAWPDPKGSSQMGAPRGFANIHGSSNNPVPHGSNIRSLLSEIQILKADIARYRKERELYQDLTGMPLSTAVTDSVCFPPGHDTPQSPNSVVDITKPGPITALIQEKTLGKLPPGGREKSAARQRLGHRAMFYTEAPTPIRKWMTTHEPRTRRPSSNRSPWGSSSTTRKHYELPALHSSRRSSSSAPKYVVPALRVRNPDPVRPSKSSSPLEPQRYRAIRSRSWMAQRSDRESNMAWRVTGVQHTHATDGSVVNTKQHLHPDQVVPSTAPPDQLVTNTPSKQPAQRQGATGSDTKFQASPLSQSEDSGFLSYLQKMQDGTLTSRGSDMKSSSQSIWPISPRTKPLSPTSLRRRMPQSVSQNCKISGLSSQHLSATVSPLKCSHKAKAIQALQEPPGSIVALNPNDLSLTDTPSPTKLKENYPNLEARQEKRRHSKTYLLSGTPSGAPATNEGSRTGSGPSSSMEHLIHGAPVLPMTPQPLFLKSKLHEAGKAHLQPPLTKLPDSGSNLHDTPSPVNQHFPTTPTQPVMGHFTQPERAGSLVSPQRSGMSEPPLSGIDSDSPSMSRRGDPGPRSKGDNSTTSFAYGVAAGRSSFPARQGCKHFDESDCSRPDTPHQTRVAPVAKRTSSSNATSTDTRENDAAPLTPASKSKPLTAITHLPSTNAPDLTESKNNEKRSIQLSPYQKSFTSNDSAGHTPKVSGQNAEPRGEAFHETDGSSGEERMADNSRPSPLKTTHFNSTTRGSELIISSPLKSSVLPSDDEDNNASGSEADDEGSNLLSPPALEVLKGRFSVAGMDHMASRFRLKDFDSTASSAMLNAQPRKPSTSQQSPDSSLQLGHYSSHSSGRGLGWDKVRAPLPNRHKRFSRDARLLSQKQRIFRNVEEDKNAAVVHWVQRPKNHNPGVQREDFGQSGEMGDELAGTEIRHSSGNSQPSQPEDTVVSDLQKEKGARPSVGADTLDLEGDKQSELRTPSIYDEIANLDTRHDSPTQRRLPIHVSGDNPGLKVSMPIKSSSANLVSNGSRSDGNQPKTPTSLSHHPVSARESATPEATS